MITSIKSKHWMKGGTGICNFSKERLQLYLAAAYLTNDPSIKISKYPMMDYSFSGIHVFSIHRTDNANMDHFWDNYRKLQNGEIDSDYLKIQNSEFKLGQRVMPIKPCLGIAGTIAEIEIKEDNGKEFLYYTIKLDKPTRNKMWQVGRAEHEIVEICDQYLTKTI